MPDPVTPPAEQPKRDFNSVYEAALNGQGAEPSTKAETTTTPTQNAASSAPKDSAPAASSAAAQAKRLLKLKLLDDKEEDLDIDEWYADEEKRKRLVADLQLGRSHAHLLTKAERAAHEKAIESAKASWNKFLQRKGFDIVEDKSDEDGWNVVPRGKAASAPTDPLEALEAEDDQLSKKIAESATVDPAWLSRRLDIQKERTKLLTGRTKSEAVSDFEKRQSEAARESARQENARKADEYLLSEIDKHIAARTKSFEGMSEAKKVRLREAAKSAGYAAFKKAGNVPLADAWQAVLAAARDAVKEEADEADALRQHALRGLPAVKEPPTSAPILDGAPSAPGAKGKTFDEEYERLVKTL